MQQKPHRTIKQARRELEEWGAFWSRPPLACSTSITALFAESQKSATVRSRRKIKHRKKGEERHTMCRGANVGFEATAVASRTPKHKDVSDIFAHCPLHISELDEFINTLRPECKKAVSDKYIRNTIHDTYWLNAAENAVMNR